MDIRKGSDDQIALEDPVIQRLSKKYGKTPAQVRVDFYAPEIKDRGVYCFCPVYHSIFLILKTLTFLVTFEQ